VSGERLRSAIEAHAWARRSVTVSIGVATLVPQIELTEPAALIAAADQALYASKAGGRNRVTHTDDSK
jgi:diguanylate cyclase (GGDEF)-like protein